MYYQSNYAAGDYYGQLNYPYMAGGFLGSIGGLIGKGLKAVGSVVPGPLGTIAKGVGGALSPTRTQLPAPAIPIMQVPSVPRGTPGATPTPGMQGVIQRALPGGASGYQGGAGSPPAGWHWNKSYSYSKGLPAGSFLVRNRAPNPGNAKALRRAIRRQSSFLGLARRVLKGSGYSIKRSGGIARRKTTRRR